MMSADWQVTSADDVAVMTSPRADVSKRRPGTWRCVEARDGALQRVAARGARELLHRIFWQHVSAHGSSNGGQVSTKG